MKMTKSDRILKESCIIAEELYWQDFFERVDEEPDTTIPEGQFERILSLIHQQPICEDINLKTLEKRTVFSKRVKAVLVAAIVILLANLVKTVPRLESIIAFWRWVVAHLECPDIRKN